MSIEIPDPAVLAPGIGRYVIRVEGATELKWGMLHLPQSAKGELNVGPIEWAYELYQDDFGNQVFPAYEKGDLVIFGKYSGTEVHLNRSSYIILKEIDILAIVKPAPPKILGDDDEIPF